MAEDGKGHPACADLGCQRELAFGMADTAGCADGIGCRLLAEALDMDAELARLRQGWTRPAEPLTRLRLPMQGDGPRFR